MNDKEKKLSLASNQNINLDELLELALDEDIDVRKAVLKNPICPDYILRKMFDNEISKEVIHKDIIYSIIMHNNCSKNDIVKFYEKFLIEFNKIYDENVYSYTNMLEKLYSIVSSSDCPVSVLTELNDLKPQYGSNYKFSEYIDSNNVNRLTKWERKIYRLTTLKLAKNKIFDTLKSITNNKNKTEENKKDE